MLPATHSSHIMKPYKIALAVLLSVSTSGISFQQIEAQTTMTGNRAVTVAEREVARRQGQVGEAAQAITRGDMAMAAKDYGTAMNDYRAAVDYLPDSVITGDQRAVALDRFSKASVQYAQYLITQGRRVDAETVLKRVLQPQYNPGYRPALQILANMENPGYYNETVTPRFVEKVERVKVLLMEAEGYYDTGRFDNSFESYEKVLNIDPYNIAARRGQEKVNAARLKYADAAYNQTRSQLLWQVAKGWEIPPKRFDLTDRPIDTGIRADQSAAVQIRQKLETIIIPQIDFRQSTIREAVEFLKSESRRLDAGEPDPTRRGVNIVLKLPTGSSMPAAVPAPVTTDDPFGAGVAVPAIGPSAGSDLSDTRITLAISNVPLGEALRYVTELAGLKFKVEQYAVAVVPITDNIEDLITREYRVAPSFFPQASAQSGAPDPNAFSFGATGNQPPNVGISQRMSALDYFRAQGVQFPEGATAQYLPSGSRLVVRNTQSNLDLIESLVSEQTEVAKQVDIEAKFIEISQNNLKELGFDWLLGQFNVAGNKVFAGGGTVGNQPGSTPADFVFVEPGTNIPVGDSLSGSGAVTAGNRSGSFGIGADTIASLLATGVTGGAFGVAPAIFGLS